MGRRKAQLGLQAAQMVLHQLFGQAAVAYAHGVEQGAVVVATASARRRAVAQVGWLPVGHEHKRGARYQLSHDAAQGLVL